MNFDKNREMMIENQLRPNKITNITLLDTFNRVSKEKFIYEDNLNICYSDQDISIFGNRGYLKNLHLAQILHFADIKNNEKVLHIGGLTGYLSVLISKLCKEIYVTEEDEKSLDNINKNFAENKVTNGYVYKNNLVEGLSEKEPFDLIIIDCPQYSINLNLLNQINVGGRLIYIEKLNNDLSKAYKMTKYKNNYSKDFLFDVFSNFYLEKKEESFNF
jgi:Protein-L-isoaspartate carboxylmethyltransferase